MRTKAKSSGQARTIYWRSAELWAKLVDYSAAHGASISSVIEDAITEYLEKHANLRVIK